MKKNVFGRQFKRDANERKALFKGLMSSLVLKERIQTTEEKAKAIKGSVEKLVTRAKIKGVAATPFLLPYLHEDAAKRMITDIAPRFINRPGGYTRIMRLGKRFGDDASVVIIEWVDKGIQLSEKNKKKVTKAANTDKVIALNSGAKNVKAEKKTDKKVSSKSQHGTKGKKEAVKKEKK